MHKLLHSILAYLSMKGSVSPEIAFCDYLRRCRGSVFPSTPSFRSPEGQNPFSDALTGPTHCICWLRKGHTSNVERTDVGKCLFRHHIEVVWVVFNARFRFGLLGPQIEIIGQCVWDVLKKQHKILVFLTLWHVCRIKCCKHGSK